MRKDNRRKTIIAPSDFVFNGANIDQCIKFLNQLMDNSVETILIDFSQIKRMEISDYMVLTAQIEKAKRENKTEFLRVGNYPKSETIKHILTDKATVKHRDCGVPDLVDLAKENSLIPRVVVATAQELSRVGIKEQFAQFETFLNEIIGNAIEHGIREKQINWWLIHSINNRKKMIRFVFVDMGIGIIGSHQKARLPLKYYIYRSKTKVPQDALYGNLRSSTRQDSRGRGLKQIRGFIEDGVVSDFVLITNYVSLRYKNGEFVTTKNKNFIGTYFSWTISKETFTKWKNSQ